MAQSSSLLLRGVRAARRRSSARVTPGVCYCCKTAVVALRRTAGSSRRGATSIPATCATSPSPSRATAAGRSPPRRGSARTAGRSTAVPTTVRRWRPADRRGAHRVADGDPRRRADRARCSTPRARDGHASRRAPACRRWAAPSRRTRRWRWTAPASSFVAWDEVLDGVRAAGLHDRGRRRRRPVRFGTPQRSGRRGADAYPVMAPLARGVIAAWTAGAPGASVIHVRRLTAPRHVDRSSDARVGCPHCAGAGADAGPSAAARRRPHAAPVRRSRALREGASTTRRATPGRCRRA